MSNRSRAARRREFFAELLPAGAALENLAAEIRVTTDEVTAVLAQFGRTSMAGVQDKIVVARHGDARCDVLDICARGVRTACHFG